MRTTGIFGIAELQKDSNVSHISYPPDRWINDEAPYPVAMFFLDMRKSGINRVQVNLFRSPAIDLPKGANPPFYMNDRKYSFPFLLARIFHSVLNNPNSCRLQGSANTSPWIRSSTIMKAP